MENSSENENSNKELYVNPICDPIATEKMSKKLLKLTKKLSNLKLIRKGVKEVNKSFRKKDFGICVLSGDVSPIDVISHIPILCEKNNVPYIYVNSRESLGAVAGTKRPTSVVMLLKPDKDNKHFENFEKMEKVIRLANPYIKDK
jgi:H/ACA ribonucleoprotein complex subunit 2